jgi:hypothetical protein
LDEEKLGGAKRAVVGESVGQYKQPDDGIHLLPAPFTKITSTYTNEMTFIISLSLTIA